MIKKFHRNFPSKKHQLVDAYALTKNGAIKDLRKYSFMQRISNIWNNLPSNVVESTHLNNFKTNLDKHWSHNPLYRNAAEDLEKEV